MSSNIVSPYGGELIDLVVSDEARPELISKARIELCLWQYGHTPSPGG